MLPRFLPAGIAQLGERQTEDLKVACSIHAHRKHVSGTFSLIRKLILLFPEYCNFLTFDASSCLSRDKETS